MIMRAVIGGIVAACTLMSGGALAQYEGTKDRYIHPNCQITPNIGTTNYPGFSSIISSNKIALPPGKALVAEGQQVFFYARVFDANCVPLRDAKIELWQANPEGKYRFATKPALATPDPVFAGGGRTYSDNQGEFMFFTLYPGPYHWRERRTGSSGNSYYVTVKRAPHFNIRITHPNLKRRFETSLYFEGDMRNEEDVKLRNVKAINQPRLMMSVSPRHGQDWNEGVQANIDIVLPEKDPWRSF